MADDYVPPPVQNRSVKPPGVLPKNLQAWVIGSVALVMVLVIAFSGRDTSRPPAPAPAVGSDVSDPNTARIQEYRERIEQQLQRLALEQAQLADAKGSLAAPSGPLTGAPIPAALAAGAAVGAERERSWIELDREKRHYESRYASNVAHSRRTAASATARPPGDPAGPKPASGQSTTGPAAWPDGRPTYRLREGTVIETVLTNRLDGSFSGPVNCLVTTDVYAPDRRRVLIPQGSRVLGSVQPVEAVGQQRLAVNFHRLITPDGTSVELTAPLPGLSQVGETGLRDRVNRHYGQIFGVSLAIGAIAGLSQINTAQAAQASNLDLYRQGVAGSLAQSSLNILERFLNVLPTFTIREGHRIEVYLTGDLDLPAAAGRHQNRSQP